MIDPRRRNIVNGMIHICGGLQVAKVSPDKAVQCQLLFSGSLN